MTTEIFPQPEVQQKEHRELPVQFIFDALHQAGIRYALLRGYDELFRLDQDLEIDLLVHPEDLVKLRRTLPQHGFVETPAWGHDPHQFFLAFNRAAGCWLKLDVVTDLCYGKPFRKYRTNLLAACFENRRLEGTYQLAYEVEFLTLLLHCLLDKGTFDSKHRTRVAFLLSEIVVRAPRASMAQDLANAHLAPALEWQVLVKAIEAGDWNLLLSKGTALQKQLRKKSPLKTVLRGWKLSVLLRLRPVFFILWRHGVSVALLAPDGAGKSTLAGNLVLDKKLRARLIYMGTNPEARTMDLPLVVRMNEIEKTIRKQNRRKTVAGRLVRGVNFVLSLLDHWYRCLMAKYQLLRGRCVVFDRFIYDAWIQKRKKTPWKRLRRFLFDAPCPTPDLVILLDAPGVLLFERKGEHSVEWIEQQRAGYLRLKELLPQMTVVDAAQTAEQVRAEVISLIWQAYDRKSGGSSH